MGCVQAVQDDPAQPHFCANALWYGAGEDKGFKDVLCQLVGWEAAGVPPILRMQETYDNYLLTSISSFNILLPRYRLVGI
jgi:hypothetical protein